MCNEEILKHMKEDMTFRGLAERTRKSNTFKKIWAIYKWKTKIRKDSRWKIKTSTKSWKK